VADGRVLVATEDDDVFALDPATGRVIWQESLGQPLRDVVGQAGCGDIDPLGITSTPVVDNATDTLYVVAEVSVAGRQPVHHELAGIDINSGRVTFEADADPPVPAGENVVHLLQRAALLLANGRVYVSYGGQYGDCGDYHGWVVGVPTDGAPRTAFNITPDSSGGAVWQGGGGPSVDAAGNIYVSTGNPNSSGPAPWAEAVVKLSPTLTSPPEAAFQDRYATGDLDLATGDVVVLPNGEVFAVGKTDIPYLLTQDHLVDAGHFSGRVCGSDPDGGAAYDSLDNSLYVPCQDGGLSEVNLTDRHIRSFAVGVNSAPILVDGELWALSYPSGRLEEVDPRSGSVLQKISVGQDVPHFASPSAAGGLLLVGTTAGIVAFTGPGGPTLG
jgi:outer membrane protein assembly factor BamB